MRNRKTKEERRNIKLWLMISVTLSVIIAIAAFLYTKNYIISLVSLFISFGLITLYLVARSKLKKSQEVKKIETVFPDFLQLMASNLRAGMTVDQALLASSRKEFAPLDEEITQMGKDLVTGREIDKALKAMAERIKSEKITKTIALINSGIRSGGDIAVLLEQTAINMREKIFTEKKSASNVLMYEIFILFAVAIGAPTLFALSTVLVGVLTNLLSGLPTTESTIPLPFSLSTISISVGFVTLFSIVFIITTNILGALVVGLVRKGEEKEGIKYMVPLIAISLIIFFLIKYILSGYFSGIV